MKFKTYDIAREFLIKKQKINFSDSFDLIKLASKLLRTADQEKHGRDLIIRVKDAIQNEQVDKKTITIWNDLLGAAGLYPYVDPSLLDDCSLIRYEYHKSPFLKEIYLHEEQFKLSLDLQEKRSVVVSAPTSFGKSLLIEEVVASKKYKNIVIIQPTLALLDETRKNLLKYKEDYKIIVSTSQQATEEEGNIFLFTGERVVEYENFPKIDFFVIDEFYKLSLERDDDRAIALNQALYKLMKYTSQFYMLGPMIKSIPITLQDTLNLTWQRTDFATVAVDETNINLKAKKVKEKNIEKKEELFKLLAATSEPTLVYCSAPAKCTELAIEFVDYIVKSNAGFSDKNNSEIKDMVEWIKENINKAWGLIKALENGIAFHHGALPRHLGSSIVDGFNHYQIRFLFCTATLIEGVNTSAKNVILFDKSKGNKPIDFFDYKNIAGRSGRMRKHYIGNVIRFEKEPPQLELEVDIPILTQDNAPLEILLAIDTKDIKPELKNKLAQFEKLPEDLKEVVKKNSSVNIQGQLDIIKELENGLLYYHPKLSWISTPPNFECLAAVVDIAWRNLARPDDSRMYIEGIGKLSARWLTSFAFSYINNKSIGGVINQYINDAFWIQKIPDLQTRINRAAFYVLHISRHWFDYKLPKWITIVSQLQEYVFLKNNMKPGNYTYTASSLENGFLAPGLSALREYDIPITAIRKLRAFLEDYRTPEQNIMYVNQLSSERLKSAGLIEYEIKKIRDAF